MATMAAMAGERRAQRRASQEVSFMDAISEEVGLDLSAAWEGERRHARARALARSPPVCPLRAVGQCARCELWCRVGWRALRHHRLRRKHGRKLRSDACALSFSSSQVRVLAGLCCRPNGGGSRRWRVWRASVAWRGSARSSLSSLIC
eukprot:960499-Prymnesium_polylepis.1